MLKLDTRSSNMDKESFDFKYLDFNQPMQQNAGFLEQKANSLNPESECLNIDAEYLNRIADKLKLNA